MFKLAIVISIVYIFDVSAYPYMHIPFVFLTLLYFGSLAEVYGIGRTVSYIRRKVNKSQTSVSISMSTDEEILGIKKSSTSRFTGRRRLGVIVLLAVAVCMIVIYVLTSIH